MPHPRVLEMRRRLVKLMNLADEAERNGKGRQAARILAALDRGGITYEEALAKLKELARR